MIKKADEIFGLVLRNVFRQPKSIQEFKAFIKKVRTDFLVIVSDTKCHSLTLKWFSLKLFAANILFCLADN